jgi:hypothetical protein
MQHNLPQQPNQSEFSPCGHSQHTYRIFTCSCKYLEEHGGWILCDRHSKTWPIIPNKDTAIRWETRVNNQTTTTDSQMRINDGEL